MQPIHELLARIRHDPNFGTGQFEIGFLDRVEGTIQRVAFREISFPEGERRVFEVLDGSGQARRIPFPRIREVWRDVVVIWQRPSQAAPLPEGRDSSGPLLGSRSAPTSLLSPGRRSPN